MRACATAIILVATVAVAPARYDLTAGQVPAGRFGAAEHLGRIVPGLIADLTVLKGDPSGNIRMLAQVQYTVRDGSIIYRAAR